MTPSALQVTYLAETQRRPCRNQWDALSRVPLTAACASCKTKKTKMMPMMCGQCPLLLQ